jgi:hypothetical protein
MNAWLPRLPTAPDFRPGRRTSPGMLRTLLFCAALAETGQSHALIDSGAFGTPGELFIAVFDSDGQVSYYKDLGVNMDDFLKNPSGAFDLGQDPNFDSFKGKTDLIYNIGADYPLVDDFSNLETWGYLATSSSGPDVFDSGFNSLDASKQIFQVYIGLLNPSRFTGTAAEIEENLSGVFGPDDEAYFDGGQWGFLMGGVAGGDTTGRIGQPLPFYHVNNQTGEEVGTVTGLGFWTLAADGRLSFSVGGGNISPVASAGDDRTVGQGARITLDGTGSSDPDNGPQPLTYVWTQLDGPAVALDSANTANPGFQATAAGVYRFRLTVSDGEVSAEDTVQITVKDSSENAAPVADAGADQTATLGGEVVLDGSASRDPDDAPSPLTFAWSQISGPEAILSGTNVAIPRFTPQEAGNYVFQLTVSDGVASSVDAVTVTVQAAAENQPPVADAGSDRTVAQGVLVVLDGGASADPDDGPAALTFSWVQSGGPEVSLSDADTASPTFSADQAGTYTFELTVSDGAASSRDTVRISVESSADNQPPVADAGPDRTVALGLGGQVALDGSGSSDPDNGPAALVYAWTQIGGPPVALNGADTAGPSFSATEAGDYAFRLTVSDGAASAEDTVLIHAESGNGDVPPNAVAGSDQTVNAGSEVTLDGGSTTGSGPLSYSWSQTGGPIDVALSGRDSARATITPVKPGLYTFRLMAGNALGSSEDSVQVNVLPVGPAIVLDVPGVWRSGEKQKITWSLNEIPGKRPATVFFAKNGVKFKALKTVKAKKLRVGWKPKSADATDQGVLRICVKPAKKAPPVCDSVGIAVQPRSRS